MPGVDPHTVGGRGLEAASRTGSTGSLSKLDVESLDRDSSFSDDSSSNDDEGLDPVRCVCVT